MRALRGTGGRRSAVCNVDEMNMRARSIASRLCAAWVLAIVLPGLSGCSHPEHRVQDALDMADLGLTFSKKPKFAAFKGCAGALSLGFGDVEGYFVGLGHGKLGVTSFSHEGLGLALWGKHRTRFGAASNDVAGVLDFQKTGVLGLADGPIVGPDQEPACIQQLHVGWAGVVANANWLQVADFLLGCTGIDICFDDGKKRGDGAGNGLVTAAAHKPKPAKTGATPKPAAPRLAKAVPVTPPIAAHDLFKSQVPKRPVSPKPGPSVVAVNDKPETPPGGRRPRIAPAPTPPPPRKAVIVCPMWAGPRKYRVREGDVGLMQIARVYLGDAARWKEIARLNRIEHPYTIRVGQEILLPE